MNDVDQITLLGVMFRRAIMKPRGKLQVQANSSSWITVDGSGSGRTLSTRPSNMTLVNDRPQTESGIEISFPELDGREPTEQLDTLKDMLEKATRLKEGAVNFLWVSR